MLARQFESGHLLNFIYAHMNRAIKAHDLNAIFICGPGHGDPAVVANTYLEGTYTELYRGSAGTRGDAPA